MNEIIRVFKTLFADRKRKESFPELREILLKNTVNKGNEFKRKGKSSSWAVAEVVTQKERVFSFFRIIHRNHR